MAEDMELNIPDYSNYSQLPPQPHLVGDYEVNRTAITEHWKVTETDLRVQELTEAWDSEVKRHRKIQRLGKLAPDELSQLTQHRRGPLLDLARDDDDEEEKAPEIETVPVPETQPFSPMRVKEESQDVKPEEPVEAQQSQVPIEDEGDEQPAEEHMPNDLADSEEEDNWIKAMKKRRDWFRRDLKLKSEREDPDMFFDSEDDLIAKRAYNRKRRAETKEDLAQCPDPREPASKRRKMGMRYPDLSTPTRSSLSLEQLLRKKKSTNVNPIDLADVGKLQLTRATMMQYLYLPRRKYSQLLLNRLVRLHVAGRDNSCQVGMCTGGFCTSTKYKCEKQMCDVYFQVIYNNVRWMFPINAVSNSPIEGSEWNSWTNGMVLNKAKRGHKKEHLGPHMVNKSLVEQVMRNFKEVQKYELDYLEYDESIKKSRTMEPARYSSPMELLLKYKREIDGSVTESGVVDERAVRSASKKITSLQSSLLENCKKKHTYLSKIIALTDSNHNENNVLLHRFMVEKSQFGKFLQEDEEKKEKDVYARIATRPQIYWDTGMR